MRRVFYRRYDAKAVQAAFECKEEVGLRRIDAVDRSVWKDRCEAL